MQVKLHIKRVHKVKKGKERKERKKGKKLDVAIILLSEQLQRSLIAFETFCITETVSKGIFTIFFTGTWLI